ncbi:D-2-hydroxyacid dehydrogenase [Pseudoteredinibacter isoporae]|uniref:Glycerate dehydrogenase n=1 Tax=Pseudoteredinibacter isoporae TaxID=570281 RepID=A0A7X0MWQ3_9GAMM|nr:D-2-hydroxyacid dehydrogenase [Pseudoteredinibacter isoporae]MBB6522961.1 glycerate dehydrogenase [Pseudoteredinibacter isoporae]
MQNAVILDADSLGPSDLDLSPLLDQVEHWQIHGSTHPEERIERCRNAELIVSNKVIIDAELLDACPNIKLVLIAATGSNNVDLKAAAAKGVTVCNVAGYGTASVAQHCWAMILNLATQLQRYDQAAKNGQWSKSPFFCLLDYPIVELQGKTLGLIGHGSIGQAVANIAEAFGMEVLIAARKGQDPTSGDTSRTAFPELIEQSDVISLHCPLTAETENLIAETELRAMKNGALLINVSRGGLIDETALKTALQEGWIAGAALDTLRQEPPAEDHPLLALQNQNLVLSPHSAWGSREARQRLVNIMAENLGGFLKGTPQNRLC